MNTELRTLKRQVASMKRRLSQVKEQNKLDSQRANQAAFAGMNMLTDQQRGGAAFGQMGMQFNQPRSRVSMVGTMPQLGPLPDVQMRLGPTMMQQPQFQPAYPLQGGSLWVPQAGAQQQQMQPMQQRNDDLKLMNSLTAMAQGLIPAPGGGKRRENLLTEDAE